MMEMKKYFSDLVDSRDNRVIETYSRGYRSYEYLCCLMRLYRYRKYGIFYGNFKWLRYIIMDNHFIFLREIKGDIAAAEIAKSANHFLIISCLYPQQITNS